MARPRKASDEAILDGVGRVLRAGGGVESTLARFGAEVGLSAAALTQRFGSKAGLLEAYAARRASRATWLFDAARRRHVSPLAVLEDALERLVEGEGSGLGELGFLVGSRAEAELARHVTMEVRALEGEIEALLDQALVTGEIVGAEAPALARVVHSLVRGTQVVEGLRGRPATGEGIRALLDAVLAPYRAPYPDA